VVHAKRLKLGSDPTGLTPLSDVEDVVLLEERVVRLDPSSLKSEEFPTVLDEPTRRVEIEHPRPPVAHVPEEMDDLRRREDVRARRSFDDLVSDMELDLAFEDVERVAVPFVEVGLDAASRLNVELDQRELGTGGFDHARPDELALTDSRTIGGL
jgi:hypothetical protein